MRLRWSFRAKDDVERLWQFLANRSVAYADRIEQRIVDRAQSLLTLPHQGRRVAGRSERELSIPDVQYVIVYDIEADEVRIVRVWHSRQNREES